MDNHKEHVHKETNVPLLAQNGKAKNKCLILSLTLILALGALGTGLCTLFLHKQLKNELTAGKASFFTQLEQLKQNQTQALKQIKGQLSDTVEAQTQLQARFENLSNQLQNAMNQKFYQNQDWLLLKARHYLELAQINAHWNDNLVATTALLEQADQLLKPINDPKIFNIRQAIAKDMAQIQASPPVDIVGLLSQLDAVQNSINDLSIPWPDQSEGSSIKNNQSEIGHFSSGHTQFENSINFLKKLVVIRRHDKRIKPLMSPEIESLIKENLHLNLQEAQSAVLNHNSFAYQLVLKQAINTIKRNFNENKPIAADLIKRLNQLQQINIISKKLDIGSALPLLNEVIDARKVHISLTVKKQGGESL